MAAARHMHLSLCFFTSDIPLKKKNIIGRTEGATQYGLLSSGRC